MCRAPRERSRGRPSRVRRHPARIRGHPARIRGRRERYRGQPWIVPFPGPCHATAGSAAHRPGCGHGPDPGRRRPGSRPGRSTDAHHATGKRPTRPCPAPPPHALRKRPAAPDELASRRPATNRPAAPHGPPAHGPQPLARPQPSARPQPRHTVPAPASRSRQQARPAPLFEYRLGYGSSPQIRRLFSVHTLGTGKLSRSASTAVLCESRPPSSRACGLVDEHLPQAVDDGSVHSPCRTLSTGDPQVVGGCPQRSASSPHPCPLFGKTPPPLTASSESRHTELPDRDVGNERKTGDAAGENPPRPVGGMCRTSCSPQSPRVVHDGRPQGPWTKSRRRPAETWLSTVSTGPTTTPDERERGIRFEVGPVHNCPPRARLPRATSRPRRAPTVGAVRQTGPGSPSRPVGR